MSTVSAISSTPCAKESPYDPNNPNELFTELNKSKEGQALWKNALAVVKKLEVKLVERKECLVDGQHRNSFFQDGTIYIDKSLGFFEKFDAFILELTKVTQIPQVNRLIKFSRQRLVWNGADFAQRMHVITYRSYVTRCEVLQTFALPPETYLNTTHTNEFYQTFYEKNIAGQLDPKK